MKSIQIQPGQAPSLPKSKSRDRILNAAVDCLSEYGFSKTNMDEVARRAGTARSTLYRHFNDRDELILSVMEREALYMGGEIQGKIQKYQDLSEYLVEGMLLADEAIRMKSKY